MPNMQLIHDYVLLISIPTIQIPADPMLVLIEAKIKFVQRSGVTCCCCASASRLNEQHYR